MLVQFLGESGKNHYHRGILIAPGDILEMPEKAIISHGANLFKDAHKKPVDINSATYLDLVSLPHIEETTALKLIEARPFRVKNDLKDALSLSIEQWRELEPFIVIESCD